MTFVGKFWTATALLFIALRLADVLNAFTGLWIIPKYLSEEMLGAVLPLLQFGLFIALPLNALMAALVRTLVTDIASNKSELAAARIRALLRITLVALALSIAVGLILSPWICKLLRIQAQWVGAMAITYGLLTSFMPVFTAALQATKKFGALGVAGLISAPIRLGAMILLLPGLTLVGYFIGQCTPLLITMLIAWFTLRPLLKEAFGRSAQWKADIHEIFRYAGWTFLGSLAGVISALTLTILIRKTLPDETSAQYYLLSRFSEIATYCAATLSTVFFPFVIEGHVTGKDTRRLLTGSIGIILLGGSLLALALWVGLPILFPILGWDLPANSAALTAYLTLIATFASANGTLCLSQAAKNSFRYLWITLPATAILIAAYFTLSNGTLPRLLHITSAATALQFIALLIERQLPSYQRN